MQNRNITATQVETLKDIAAFINYAIDNDLNNLSYWSILGHISHDIQGILRVEDKCFLPRTKGYSKIVNK